MERWHVIYIRSIILILFKMGEITDLKGDIQLNKSRIQIVNMLENQVKKFLFKMKEYQIKDRPIEKLEGYWFKTMQNFWEAVLLMEKRYGVTYLIEQQRKDLLELDTELMEYYKGLIMNGDKNARKALFKTVYGELEE